MDEVAASARVDVPFSSWFGLSRHIIVGAMAATVAGLVGGVGGRIVMRIAGAASGSSGAGRITEAGFTVGEVTVVGSMILAFFIGILSAAFGGGAYLIMRPWLGWAGRFRGLVFGIALFALASATSDMMNPDNRDFAILGNEVFVVALIVVLFISFGVVIEIAFTRFDRWFQPESDSSRSASIAAGTIAIFGLLTVVPIVVLIIRGGEGVCECEPPTGIPLSFLVVAVSTAVVWLASVVTWPTWVTRMAIITGFGGTLGVFVFGLMRAISDAAEIIG